MAGSIERHERHHSRGYEDGLKATECVKRLARSVLSALTPDLYGEVVLKVQAGKVVRVQVMRDQKPEGEVEVIDLFKSIVIG